MMLSTPDATETTTVRKARPPIMRIMSSSWGAYATDESGSLAKMGG